MANTKFVVSNQNQQIGLPYSGAEPITPGTPCSQVSRGIYCGGAGNITVTLYPTGDSVQFQGVLVGTFLPVEFQTVSAATATNLLALY